MDGLLAGTCLEEPYPAGFVRPVRTADQAAARVFVVPPPSWEWAGGERTFICFAEAGDGALRTTSLRPG